MSMQDLNMPLSADGGPDDLPRTLRRERDRLIRERGGAPPLSASGYAASDMAHGQPVPAAVTRFDVPFARLMFFFIKAVFAAVPAILLLIAILWGLGHLLQKFFPQLVKLQILIWFPN